MNHNTKRLKLLLALCVEKDMTTRNDIHIRHTGTLGRGTSLDLFSNTTISVNINGNEKKQVNFDFYMRIDSGVISTITGVTLYPLDRIINFIGGLK